MDIVYEYYKKIKSFIRASKNDLFVAAIIFLIGIIGFGLGRLTVFWPKKEPLRIIEGDGVIPEAVSNTIPRKSKEFAGLVQSVSGNFVASKSGSVYHLPSCAGAKKIKEENKMWFQTKEEAEALGLRPAGNCDGL